MDEGAKNCKITDEASGFTNRNSWKNAQESNNACSVAKQLLSSGKPPPKAMGKTAEELRAEGKEDVAKRVEEKELQKEFSDAMIKLK